MDNGDIQPDTFMRRPVWEAHHPLSLTTSTSDTGSSVERNPRVGKVIATVLGVSMAAVLLQRVGGFTDTSKDTELFVADRQIGCETDLAAGLFYRESGIFSITSEGVVSVTPGIECVIQSAIQLGPLHDYGSDTCTSIGAPNDQGQFTVSLASRERNILRQLSEGALASWLQVKDSEVMYCGYDDRVLLPQS